MNEKESQYLTNGIQQIVFDDGLVQLDRTDNFVKASGVYAMGVRFKKGGDDWSHWYKVGCSGRIVANLLHVMDTIDDVDKYLNSAIVKNTV